MIFAIKPLATRWNFVTEKFFQPNTINVLVSFLVRKLRQGEKNIWGPSVSKVLATYQLSMIWHACRSRGNELQRLPRGDPRNLCADMRIRLLATHSLMSVNMWTKCCSIYRLMLSCYVWLLVSVDIHSTDAFSTRDHFLLSTYPVRKFGAWQSLKTALFRPDYHS